MVRYFIFCRKVDKRGREEEGQKRKEGHKREEEGAGGLGKVEELVRREVRKGDVIDVR